MNKKFNRLCLMILTLLVSAGTLMGAENKNLGMYINNTQVAFSNTTGYPRVDQGKTLVPINLISSYLGYSVGWDQKAQKVTISKKDTSIELTVGSNKAIVNRKTVVMDTTANVSNNRTYVPLRFVAENMGVKVEYKVVNGKKAVYLTMPNGEEVKVPEVEVGTLVGTAGDDHEANMDAIYNYFGENAMGEGAPTYNPLGGSIENSFIAVGKGPNGEAEITLYRWNVPSGAQPEIAQMIGTVKPVAKELFNFYLPNGGDKLYKILDDGFNFRWPENHNYLNADIQKYLGGDGRSVVIEAGGGRTVIKIGHKK